MHIALVVAYCFFPIAGFVADTKCGHYKTVMFGLWLLLPAFLLLMVGFSLEITSTLAKAKAVAVLLQGLGTAILVITGIVLIVNLAGFPANVLQLGMDQMYEYGPEPVHPLVCMDQLRNSTSNRVPAKAWLQPAHS